MTEVLTEIRKEFFNRLNTKTSWGKNEIIKMYDDIVIEKLNEQNTKLLDDK